MNFSVIPGVSLHARQRAVQRLGRDPDRDHWLAAVASILTGTALFLGRSPQDGKERFRVRLGPLEIDVWWATDTAQIVTVLDIGQSSLNPARQAQREAEVRKRRLPDAYRRERVRLDDWR